MSREELRQLTETVSDLARRLANEPRLQAELQRARRQFFGDDGALSGNRAAEHRFAEWFLLERESEVLGAVPATVEPYVPDADDLLDTRLGAFLVVSTGATTTARDIEDDEVFELSDDDGLMVGDLIVGRLYPVRGERWAASLAAPVLRPGREVAEAFQRDLEQLDLGRRLQQIELEHLLVQRQGGGVRHADVPVPAQAGDPPPPLEHLEADLEQLLQSVGDRHSATVLSQQLAVAERPGALIGPLLDQLAFDTDVDLDRARELLLEIWNAHHAGDAPSTEQPDARSSGGPPGETLGERFVRELDDGLGKQRNVEELFKELEQIAGVEPDAADDDDDDDARAADMVEKLAGGGEGDLAPLVTEYLWETGQNDADDAPAGPLALWVELQQNAPVPRSDFDAITANDLMRLLLHVYLRAAPGHRADDVRAAFDELGRFYEWVRQTQELDRVAVLGACRGVLLEQLDRLQAAGEALTSDAPALHPPGLLQIEDLGKDGFGARDDDGGHHWLLASAPALAQLRVGDLVLAGLGEFVEGPAGGANPRRLAGMAVVLPIDARSLIE